MFVQKAGLVYAIFIAIAGYLQYKLIAIAYLTTWNMNLQILTLFVCTFIKNRSELKRKLLILSWTCGWTVVIIFWGFIFPFTDSSKLPPTYQYISTHGGVHMFVVVLFFRNKFEIQGKDILLPLGLYTVYMFGMLLPLKIFGIKIYPLIFEKFWPTIIAFIIIYVANLGIFWIGYVAKKKFKKQE
ncbi:hypothetical protein SteCoe_1562 [Stentor coeruleus]|uniref:Uncharacterized protein n=1 Tax=Stentor coeruleus TaxID=5963 RepID=A0A1R2D1R7_9CILI|nr:hypothetical protein SteCoe_1562 [Stentor coeruleus]